VQRHEAAVTQRVGVETITILDDDADLRSLMGELFETALGLKSVQVRSVAQLVERASAVLGTRLAILDLNLGPEVPSGFDAYDWLRTHHYTGHIVFLTGHAQSDPLLQRARALDNVEVLQKPVPTDQLLALASHEAKP
jgi:FixJ family two-component response regulator